MNEHQETLEMEDTKPSYLPKLIGFSIIIYACILIIHGFVIYYLDTQFSIFISDQLVFFNRGIGIIRGDLPYRDFYTHAAPLSPYLWAPIVLISMLFTWNNSTEYLTYETFMDSSSMLFSSYVFRVFFAICLILSAVLLYKILEKKGTKRAFWISLSYSINPYFLYLVSFWGSDECILPLLIILPIYLLEKEKYYLVTLSLIVGTGLKYFPILLLPLFFVYNHNLRSSLIQLVLFLIGIIASYLPFYLIAPEAFSDQFNYVEDNARSQGLAALDAHLSQSGLTLGSTFEFLTLTIMFVGVISTIIILTRNTWFFEKTIVLLAPFLIFFPKIQFSYFVIIYPFIFVMIFTKTTSNFVYFILFLSSILGGIAADYILTYTGTNIFSYIAAWVITLILYSSLLFSLLHMLLYRTRN